MIGCDRDPAVIDRARERGAIDRAVKTIAELAATCDTLVLAIPVDAAAEALEELRGTAGPRLIVDVASVKAPLQRYAGLVPNYVGTHPMAGRERGGIDAAGPDLFAAATWAFVPHADRGLIERVGRFIAAMGARPLEIEATRHDAIVALTSHLPQAVAVVLAAELAPALSADRHVAELCGPGIMSMLRLARSPATIWSPIMKANAAPLAGHLRSLAALLVTAAEGLDGGDTKQLMSYFDVASGVMATLERPGTARLSPPSAR